jgi:flagellar basal-body rod protein FlgF
MPYGLYLSAEGAYAQSQRLDVLSNNMANVATPGFKRDVALFQCRLTQAQQEALPPAANGLDQLGGGVRMMATATDYSMGPLQQTKNDGDMAIGGDGFFMVRHGNRDFLTRAGNFQMTATGQLVTQNGDAVLSEDRNPIEIDPEGGPWQITPDGGMSQAGDVIKLAMVRPRSMGDLAKIGDNLFAPLAPTQPVPDEQRQMLWHSLEQSTVKPSAEMMELIEASRAFEMNVSMIHTQDEVMGTLINRTLLQT